MSDEEKNTQPKDLKEVLFLKEGNIPDKVAASLGEVVQQKADKQRERRLKKQKRLKAAYHKRFEE